MEKNNNKPIIVQCDFDGTVTIGDLSFQILDKYADTDWRVWWDEYLKGIKTVNEYNITAFSHVSASEKELDSFAKQHVVLREGLLNLINTCKAKNIRFYFVSNGMSFYIKSVLDLLNIQDTEFAAAKTTFTDHGIIAEYLDPYGNAVQNGFKLKYSDYFRNQGYQIIYIGNGLSDYAAACTCDRIYAIETLQKECDKYHTPYITFNDLNDIAKDIAENY